MKLIGISVKIPVIVKFQFLFYTHLLSMGICVYNLAKEKRCENLQKRRNLLALTISMCFICICCEKLALGCCSSRAISLKYCRINAFPSISALCSYSLRCFLCKNMLSFDFLR